MERHFVISFYCDGLTSRKARSGCCSKLTVGARNTLLCLCSDELIP
jgi:hypothetical protein